MKKTLFLGLLLAPLLIYAQPSNYSWGAEFDGWTYNTMNNDQPISGAVQYTKQATSSNDEFVLNWNSGADHWQQSTSFPIGSIATLFWCTSNCPNTSLSSNTTNNYYYTLNVKELAYANISAILHETSANPVNFAASNPISISPAASNVYIGQPTTVTVNLSASKSSEEKCFIRYHDGGGNDGVVEVSFTGSTGTATIPGSFNTSGRTVNYYAFTTTLANAPSQRLDDGWSSLRFQSGGSYTVASTYQSTIANGNGGCDGSWDNLDCWDGGVLPDSNQEVIVDDDIEVDVNTQIGSITVQSGASLTFASGNTLTITGDLDLTGTINLNGGNITFDDSATFSTASSSNYIIIDSTNGGKVRKNFNATGAWTFHIGENDGTTEYSPIQVDFQTGTTFSSAYVEASVENTKHPNNSSTTDFINRYWTLTSSGISNMDCDITATYVDDDINGTEADIVCGKYSSGSWSAGSIDTANNHLLFTGATTFSDITGGEASALPVSLINFSIFLNPDNQAQLSWSTASELNASHFNVHRSLDGVTKTKIGEVNAQGTSNTVVNYQFTDVEPIQQHTLYFLEQLDFDGATEWFGPVAVNMPFSDGITATFNKQTSNLEILFHRPPEVRNGQITILNAVGQQILDLEIALPNSQETALINLPALPSGVYFVNTQVGRRLYSTKLHY